MPAQLDDPYTPTHFRRSAAPPYPTPHSTLPPDITPYETTLKPSPGTSEPRPATVLPFTSATQIPRALLELIHATYNAEILDGNTYPMLDPLPALDFQNYWFGVFGAVMLLGTASENTKLIRKSLEKSGSFTPEEWEGLFIGTFYVKPNYPGRSSHVCNAGFLVAPPFRGSGGGRRMGFKGKYVDAIVFGKKLGDCNQRTLQDARTDQATVQGVS
ncbi:MAG: hypothetical protein Q9162_007212 [Coniocarpon cinnabarinum]